LLTVASANIGLRWRQLPDTVFGEQAASRIYATQRRPQKVADNAARCGRRHEISHSRAHSSSHRRPSRTFMPLAFSKVGEVLKKLPCSNVFTRPSSQSNPADRQHRGRIEELRPCDRLASDKGAGVGSMLFEWRSFEDAPGRDLAQRGGSWTRSSAARMLLDEI